MTQDFDSAALELLNRAYGLAGGGAQRTFLQDDDIQQVMEVRPINRRSRTPFLNGLFTAILRNVHPAAAGELRSFVNPYIVVNAHNGFPDPVNQELFDIYFLGASAQVNGATAAASAAIAIDWPAGIQGMSDLAAGGPINPADFTQGLFGWDDFSFSTAAEGILCSDGSGNMWKDAARMRLPHEAQLIFISETDAATARTFTAHLLFSIVPITSGQDYR